MNKRTNDTILYKINVVTSYEDTRSHKNVTCFFSFIICNVSLYIYIYIGWINLKFLWTEEDATAFWSCFERRTSCVSWNSFLITVRVCFVCFVAILFSLTLLLTYLTTLNSRISITIWSWEQWHLRVVVNNTPRPVSDDSAAVIERQRIQVRIFLMKYGIKKEDYHTIYLFNSYNFL